MGLMNLIQNGLLKLVVANKEKLVAVFLERLAEEYLNNRGVIASEIMGHLPASWKVTATADEMTRAMDILKKFIEDMYAVIQEMRQPQPVGPMPPRTSAKI